ncbi:molybdopterin converting factor subunit 1 [Devosia naphthalenivorans]|uniref:molybdopterin converting factor subunit 1 n=1 Tax=Devosia naphthalenivorans TaxID=2082392 RepID=UPI000D3BCAD4|nr:molybdopterin converting factor subunit 1 [Devosia naphthalenivorans]
MRILYFAWLRERLNKGEEEVNLPEQVRTVSDLLSWLASTDEAADLAFGDRRIIRAAVDERLVGHDASISGARTVALFPPMTGG